MHANVMVDQIDLMCQKTDSSWNDKPRQFMLLFYYLSHG